jgi:hypothetical protein
VETSALTDLLLLGVIACEVVDLIYCKADEKTCAVEAEQFARQCARRACYPGEYRSNRAAKEWECSRRYLLIFDALCELAVWDCIVNCGFVKAAPIFPCEPNNPCKAELCCSVSVCLCYDPITDQVFTIPARNETECLLRNFDLPHGVRCVWFTFP